MKTKARYAVVPSQGTHQTTPSQGQNAEEGKGGPHQAHQTAKQREEHGHQAHTPTTARDHSRSALERQRQQLQKLRRPLKVAAPAGTNSCGVSGTHTESTATIQTRTAISTIAVPVEGPKCMPGSPAWGFPQQQRGSTLKRMVRRFREAPPRSRQERLLQETKEYDLLEPAPHFWWLEGQSSGESFEQHDEHDQLPGYSLEELIDRAKKTLDSESLGFHWEVDNDRLVESILQTSQLSTGSAEETRDAVSDLLAADIEDSSFAFSFSSTVNAPNMDLEGIPENIDEVSTAGKMAFGKDHDVWGSPNTNELTDDCHVWDSLPADATGASLLESWMPIQKEDELVQGMPAEGAEQMRDSGMHPWQGLGQGVEDVDELLNELLRDTSARILGLGSAQVTQDTIGAGWGQSLEGGS